jgi:hypothetical protein
VNGLRSTVRGDNIHGDTLGVAGNVKDLDAGIFADEIGGQVEAANTRHDHVYDGQIDLPSAFPD